MAHAFIGFPASGKASDANARGLVTDAIAAVSHCYAAVYKGGSFAEKMAEKWFGTDIASVQTAGGTGLVAGMKLIKATLAGSVKFEWNATENGTNAECFAPAVGGWHTGSLAEAKNRLQGTGASATRSQTFRIVLYPPIFRMRVQGTKELPLSNGNIADQNQIGTLVHEITHAILNTDDETANPYGVANATLMASTASATACNNAENWGFFCSEFADQMVWNL